MTEKCVARVDKYFGRLGVAAVTITSGEIRLGDQLRFLGPNTDFHHIVSSMQIDHRPVDIAHPGNRVGILTGEKVRDSDQIYLIQID